MTAFRYRAVTGGGQIRVGAVEGLSVADALDQVRRQGLTPIEAVAVRQHPAKPSTKPVNLNVLVRAFGELAILLNAGSSIDHALAVVAEDMQGAANRAAFEALRASVREGRSLSAAMADARTAFPPMAAAMVAAGEADGRPAEALAELAETLERLQALRSTLISAAIYPALLLVIAVGVIGLMLFWVVPQFEGLFSDATQKLPPMTVAVLAISRFARRWAALGALALVVAAVAAANLVRRPSARRGFDRWVLKVPRLGEFVAMTETARLVRIAASLVEGGVALPESLFIARGSLTNSHMAEAIGNVAKRLREGEGLTGPLAQTGVFPKLAISYLRTGEQTAQLPLMLRRLADTLDREIKTRLERAIALLTPLLTVTLGAIVAIIIASVMTAIIGFDDLAISQ